MLARNVVINRTADDNQPITAKITLRTLLYTSGYYRNLSDLHVLQKFILLIGRQIFLRKGSTILVLFIAFFLLSKCFSFVYPSEFKIKNTVQKKCQPTVVFSRHINYLLTSQLNAIYA
ncbi:conserved hypothetical protein [Trichinella spiralis]|uniref:hypothetical protein n=1 Tax=Trichinella spiralis TaxID=6334 RepID=UPI0001EFD20F|nr:conserved hypothetical protein [Trichinella spiralis]